MHRLSSATRRVLSQGSRAVSRCASLACVAGGVQLVGGGQRTQLSHAGRALPRSGAERVPGLEFKDHVASNGNDSNRLSGRWCFEIRRFQRRAWHRSGWSAFGGFG